MRNNCVSLDFDAAGRCSSAPKDTHLRPQDTYPHHRIPTPPPSPGVSGAWGSYLAPGGPLPVRWQSAASGTLIITLPTTPGVSFWWTTIACSAMFERSLTLSLACCESRGEIMRPLRRRKSGSETPKLQSMSYGDAQTLRSVFRAPLRDARLPLRRSQLLRLLARRGLDARDPRPHIATAKCSQFLPPRPGTCRTRRRRSFDHR